ncbi:MAG: RloB family protein [Sphaerochaetaceae bacterium]|nr:RloB family protein [Sphaerochaetaceae bacterium]
MILPHRSFVREEPSRDASLIIIYCDGERREDDYFRFFQELSSNVRIEVVPPSAEDRNNSPTGLFARAVRDCDGPDPKYILDEQDQLWFVIDMDQWDDKIDSLLLHCQSKGRWSIAISNPCFEVWLYYHFFIILRQC